VVLLELESLPLDELLASLLDVPLLEAESDDFASGFDDA
jgi:hypothetical protein